MLLAVLVPHSPLLSAVGPDDDAADRPSAALAVEHPPAFWRHTYGVMCELHAGHIYLMWHGVMSDLHAGHT